jgi:hypothetical protein
LNHINFLGDVILILINFTTQKAPGLHEFDSRQVVNFVFMSIDLVILTGFQSFLF